MSDSDENYNHTLLYAALALLGIYAAYKAMESSSVHKVVVPRRRKTPKCPGNCPKVTPIKPPPVNPIVPPPVKPPVVSPKAPPSSVVASISRSGIFNNINGYLFGTSNGFAALSQANNFPSVATINSQDYQISQLTIKPNPGICFSFPSGWYYMPKVTASIMIGFPMVSVPPSYPPMGSFVGTVPYISPPDGALVGSISPNVWGSQYYQIAPSTITGCIPGTGFSSTLGLWARYSVTAWAICNVDPSKNPGYVPWMLNADSGTQVVWAP